MAGRIELLIKGIEAVSRGGLDQLKARDCGFACALGARAAGCWFESERQKERKREGTVTTSYQLRGLTKSHEETPISGIKW